MQTMSGIFRFLVQINTDVFNSSLTVRERLVKPCLCARLKARRFCYTDQHSRDAKFMAITIRYDRWFALENWQASCQFNL